MCPISASSASGLWGTASDLLREIELRRPTARIGSSFHALTLTCECCLNRISSYFFYLAACSSFSIDIQSGHGRLAASHIAYSAVIGACAEDGSSKTSMLRLSPVATDALMTIPLPEGRSMGICAAFVENFGADEGDRCRKWLGRI